MSAHVSVAVSNWALTGYFPVLFASMLSTGPIETALVI